MAEESTRRNLILRSLAIAAASFALAAVLSAAGVFRSAENALYDHRMRVTASSVRPADEIVLILLDQDSLDWAARERGWSWPWARAAYGDIVRFFESAGAASVSFDVLYTEPSVYGASDDDAFAAACASYGRVVQTVYFDSVQGNVSGWKDGAPLPADTGDGTPGSTPALFPIDPLCRSAAVLGSITGSSDADKTVRRAAVYYRYGSYNVPALGAAALQAAGAALPPADSEPESGRLLRFQSGLDAYVPYSAAQILQSYDAVLAGEQPLLDPEQFEGAYVFFGFYAPGLFDICTTPVSSVYPGVGVHVTQLDNMLQNSFIRPVPAGVSALLLLLCAILGTVPVFASEAVSSRRFGVYAASVLFAVEAASYTAAAYAAFAAGVLIPLVPPLAALAAGFGASVVVSYNQEGRQRRYLKSAFRQYLSPVVIEDLIAHPERLQLGGERRRISMYFSDVQGFTGISEKLDPASLTSLLNDYLSAMSAIILESGGTIDKYEGDAVIAFWNAPVAQADHARRALEAAVACQEKLAQLRPELEKRAGLPFFMRIGLNTGEAVVGNMGSHSRFDYTMLGDAVNLAARLEGLNKQFGTYCMCTEAAKTEAEAAGTALRFRELARAAVVGKSEAVTVYEPMSAAKYDGRSGDFTVFAEALALFYEGRFTDSAALFKSIRQTDAAADHYVRKCAELIAEPPDPAAWRGVWVATSK